MTKSNVHLLIIDPQNDFCDLPTANCPVDPTTHLRISPALPVTGAHADMQRLAALVDAGREGLNGITITLDSHHHLDIAHPTFWQGTVGGAVAPFTPIADYGHRGSSRAVFSVWLTRASVCWPILMN